MPRAYITLGLPRILHALHGIPGISQIWKTLDGEQYWIAVENLKHEDEIIDRLVRAADQTTGQSDGANVVFLFNLVLPNAWRTMPAEARKCWPTEAS